jgi:signal transduction histidine kinase
MNLRLRVTLAAIFSTALVIIIAGITLITLISNDAYKDLDNRLKKQTSLVEEVLTIDNTRKFFAVGVAARRLNPLRTNQWTDNVVPTIPTIDRGIVLRVVSPDGIFLQTEGFPGINDDSMQLGFSNYEGEKTNWRVLRQKVKEKQYDINLKTGEKTLRIKDTGIVMIVGSSTENLENTIANITNRFIFVGIICSVLAGLIGWWLGGKALSPLYILRNQTAKIRETSDLSFRVNTDSGPYEINELANQMNQLLETIEQETAIRERALLSAQDFAGNAAHELRTPLTSMITNLDVLSSNPTLDEKERSEIISELSGQQKRLVNVLDGLRILAKGELAIEEIFESIDIAEITDAIVSSAIKTSVDKNIKLNIHTGEYMMNGWDEGIKVMIGNLMNNALIHGIPIKGQHHIIVNLTEKEDQIIISVADNGTGVSLQDKQTILQRFETGSAKTAGSGLGLALVEQQVNLHNGKLEIKDSNLGGANFIVTLSKN